jgi:hypothetical protein
MKTTTTKTAKNIRHIVRPGLAVAVLGGALAIAGCNQAQNTGMAHTESTPKNIKEESHTMNGHGDHHTSASTGADEAKSHTTATRLEVESVPTQPVAGQPVTWTLRVLDAKSGQPVPELDRVHEKLMHLFVVSKDFSWFNHLHPEYQGNGTFTLKAILPRAGDYKLYADYTPKGGQQEVPQHEISMGGDKPLSSSASLTAPTPEKDGWFTTKVTAHPEGQPDVKGGATYEVALMPMPGQLKAGQEAMLHFQVRNAKGQPVQDLQPLMGAMGHAFILSSDSQRSLHAHPMEGGMNHHEGHGNHGADAKHSTTPHSGGSDVIFHTTFPTPGLYKAWGQFKHQGKVITAGFVVNVAQSVAPSTSESTSSGHDESRPHSH